MSRPSTGPFASPAAKAATRTLRKQPLQRRAKATIEAIQEAALQVLRDVGYERMTTTRVAERAGVSVGTLYQYYTDKEALARALVVAYVLRAERAMKAVLEEDTDLHTLARHFVRRFIAFKLQLDHDEALHTTFLSGAGREIVNAATASVVATLAQRIRASRPHWTSARVTEVANMWTTLVLGTTTSMLERQPDFVAEPWFAETLEQAVIALLPAGTRPAVD